jgi:hypothetical protein
MKKAVLVAIAVLVLIGLGFAVYLSVGKKELMPEVKPLTNREQAALLDQMMASSTPAKADQSAELDAMLNPAKIGETPAERRQERLLLDSMKAK